MATNRIYERGNQLELPVDSGVTSGDAVLIGDALVGVALTDRDSDGNATVQMDGVFELDATATSDGGGIAVGDAVFIDSAGDLSDDSSETHFGYALGAIAQGTSGEIQVKVGH